MMAYIDSRSKQTSRQRGTLSLLPIQIELLIQADGSVIFADLAADIIPIAEALDPNSSFTCELIDPQDADEA